MFYYFWNFWAFLPLVWSILKGPDLFLEGFGEVSCFLEDFLGSFGSGISKSFACSLEEREFSFAFLDNSPTFLSFLSDRG